MNNVAVTVLLVVALAVGLLIGMQTGGGGGDGTDEEVIRLQEENARLRRTLGERGPRLEPPVMLAGRGSGPDTRGGSGSSGTTSGAPEAEVTSFSIAQFDHPDEAFRALLAYAATMLAKGEEGHLALLETISKTFADREGRAVLEELVGDEDQAVRYVYPLLRFALNHDAEFVDMTETIFKTMAEDPQRFAQIDDDPLELFCAGVAVMLPGMVDAKRLERFRGYAVGMLETPADRQPRSVRRQRRDVQRAMASWASPVTVAEALQRLRQGDLTPEEAYAHLKRLRPEDVRGLDLDALVGPIVEKEGWRIAMLIGRLQPDPGTIAKFDARFVRVIHAGKVQPVMVRRWLDWTGRRSWDDARSFIEAGLQGGTAKTNGTFVTTALGLDPAPDEDWVDWAERTYEFDDQTRLFLKKRRQKRDG